LAFPLIRNTGLGLVFQVELISSKARANLRWSVQGRLDLLNKQHLYRLSIPASLALVLLQIITAIYSS